MDPKSSYPLQVVHQSLVIELADWLSLGMVVGAVNNYELHKFGVDPRGFHQVLVVSLGWYSSHRKWL